MDKENSIVIDDDFYDEQFDEQIAAAANRSNEITNYNN
jgi:hypothetical protein